MPSITKGLPLHDICARSEVIHATATSDRIYFIRGGKAIRHFRLPAEDWLASSFCRDIPEIRIIALPGNAALIAAAAEAGRRILLASPLMLRTRRSRNSHEQVLNCAMVLSAVRPGISKHRGGWHLMQPDERCIYRAAAALAAGEDDAVLISLLANHAVWQRIRFMFPCDEGRLARLLATLRDPRWYVDISRPSNLSKLYSFMGLQRDINETRGPNNRDMAIGVWRTGIAVPAGITRHPRGFIWRYFCKYDGSQVMRERKTTRLMLRFIRTVWLDYIAAADGYAGISEPLFIPEYWFDDSLSIRQDNAIKKDPMAHEIACAYKEHLSNFTTSQKVSR